jgi:hypothetical protein
MKPLAACRWLLTRTGILCVLVAGALATPQTARASCGDYVTVMPVKHGSHTGSEPSPDVKPQHPSPGPPRSAQPGQPSPRPEPRPCSRPNCSGLPPATAPVSASSGNLKAERWADLDGSPLPEVPGPTLLLPAEPNVAPDRHPASVYHPPR